MPSLDQHPKHRNARHSSNGLSPNLLVQLSRVSQRLPRSVEMKHLALFLWMENPIRDRRKGMEFAETRSVSSHAALKRTYPVDSVAYCCRSVPGIGNSSSHVMLIGRLPVWLR